MFGPSWFRNLFASQTDETILPTQSDLDKKYEATVASWLTATTSEKTADVAPAISVPISTPTTPVEKPSLLAELQKQAGAYELGDTDEQTIQKSYESRVKTMSDFVLAEVLTEMRLKGQAVQERWTATFPDVLAEVKKNRKSAEKEALEATPTHAMIDRMEFLKEAVSHDFEPTETKHLYNPLFEVEGKQTWQKMSDVYKFEAFSEKDKMTNQFPEETGAAREEHDNRGRQAPRSAVAFSSKDKLEKTAQIHHGTDTFEINLDEILYELELEYSVAPADKSVGIMGPCVEECTVLSGTNLTTKQPITEEEKKMFDQPSDMVRDLLDEMILERLERNAEPDYEPELEASKTSEKEPSEISHKEMKPKWLQHNRSQEEAQRAKKTAGKLKDYLIQIYDELVRQKENLLGQSLSHDEEMAAWKEATEIAQRRMKEMEKSAPSQPERSNPEKEAAKHTCICGQPATEQCPRCKHWVCVDCSVLRCESSQKTAGVHDKDELQQIPQNKFMLQYNKIGGGETYTQWFETSDGAERVQAELEENKAAEKCSIKDFSKEFTENNLKPLQRKADIASPWQVLKTEDNSEIIARITPEEVLKKSKTKDKPEEVKKEASHHFLALSAAEISAAEEPDLAHNLEGLSPEEQKLWSQYYKDALTMARGSSAAKSMHPSEVKRAAMMALLRVIRKWDPSHESKAKFTSYLYPAVQRAMLSVLKETLSLRQRAPEKFVNIDQPVSEGDEMYESETLQDVIEDVQQKMPEQELEEAQGAAVAREVLRKAPEVLEGKAKEVFDLLLQGYTISNIAEMLKYTIPNIVRYRKQIADKLEKIYKEVLKKPPTAEMSKEPEEQEAESEKLEEAPKESNLQAGVYDKTEKWTSDEGYIMSITQEPSGHYVMIVQDAAGHIIHHESSGGGAPKEPLPEILNEQIQRWPKTLHDILRDQQYREQTTMENAEWEDHQREREQQRGPKAEASLDLEAGLSTTLRQLKKQLKQHDSEDVEGINKLLTAIDGVEKHLKQQEEAKAERLKKKEEAAKAQAAQTPAPVAASANAS